MLSYQVYSLSISAQSLWYQTMGQWSQDKTGCFSFFNASFTAAWACEIAKTTTTFPIQNNDYQNVNDHNDLSKGCAVLIVQDLCALCRHHKIFYQTPHLYFLLLSNKNVFLIECTALTHNQFISHRLRLAVEYKAYVVVETGFLADETEMCFVFGSLMAQQISNYSQPNITILSTNILEKQNTCTRSKEKSLYSLASESRHIFPALLILSNKEHLRENDKNMYIRMYTFKEETEYFIKIYKLIFLI